MSVLREGIGKSARVSSRLAMPAWVRSASGPVLTFCAAVGLALGGAQAVAGAPLSDGPPRGEPAGTGWQARGSATNRNDGVRGDGVGRSVDVGSVAAVAFDEIDITPSGGANASTSVFLKHWLGDGRSQYAGLTLPGGTSQGRALFRRFCYLEGAMERPMIRFGRVRSMTAGAGQMFAIRPTYASACALQSGCVKAELEWSCWFANDITTPDRPGADQTVAWEDIGGAAEDLLAGQGVREPAADFPGLAEVHTGMYSEAPHPHSRVRILHTVHRMYRVDPRVPLNCGQLGGPSCRPTILPNLWRQEWDRAVTPWGLETRAPRDESHCGSEICWTNMEPWGTKVFVSNSRTYIEPPAGSHSWLTCQGNTLDSPCCGECVSPAYRPNAVWQAAYPPAQPLPILWNIDLESFPRDRDTWEAAAEAAAEAWNSVLAPYAVFERSTERACDWQMGEPCIDIFAQEWDEYVSASRRSGAFYQTTLLDGYSQQECGPGVARRIKAIVVINVDMPFELAATGGWDDYNYEWDPPRRIVHPRRFVIAHELGHALGLDHFGIPCPDTNAGDLMCPVRRRPAGASGQRGIHAGKELTDAVRCIFQRTPGLERPDEGSQT